jgi:hypothetical protein
MLEVSMKPNRLALSKAWKAAACMLILGWLAASVEAAVWPFEDGPGKPDKVIALWTDTVLTRSDTPPVRGFGGRLMFYEGKQDKPVKVEGVLVVYAFDENGRDSGNARPDRKYVITPQQLPAHYSKSKLGHSYSVWIPWDEVGGGQKEISLIVRFEPKTGTPIVGDQHRLLLPGRARSRDGAALPSAGSIRLPAMDAAAGGVQRTSYETPIPSGDTMGQNEDWRSRRMTTSTIPVPPGMVPRGGAGGVPAGNWQRPATPSYMPPPSWWNRGVPSGTEPVYQQPPQQPQRQPQAPSVASANPASSNWTQRQVGYPLGRQRPLGVPHAPLNHDRAQWPQPPEGSASAPGSQPGSGCSSGCPVNQPSASPPQN